ncbi:MAG: hypothetical protein PUC06_00400 [Oscillospiraceae bacterium]|nr:hypothetical protein [Oscillospiraceae bacterium]
MLDLNNLRKEKFEGVCKILDIILVVLFAAFFVLSLFPYYSVQKGEMVSARGYETKAKEDDSWSLLGYVGFPDSHSSVANWQAKMYSSNKKIIKANQANGYTGAIKSFAGSKGWMATNKKGEQNPYQDLKIPGITTKTVSIKQVGGALFLNIFALIGIALLLLKKGIGRALYSVVWAVCGALAFQFNYLLNLSSTFVRPTMLAIVYAALVVSVVATVLYAIDGRSRAKYLRSVSAAYA